MGRVRVHFALSCGREAVKKGEKRRTWGCSSAAAGYIHSLPQKKKRHNRARHANQQVNARDASMVFCSWEHCAACAQYRFYRRTCRLLCSREIVGMPPGCALGSMGPLRAGYLSPTDETQVRAEKIREKREDERRQLLLHSGWRARRIYISPPNRECTHQVHGKCGG